MNQNNHNPTKQPEKLPTASEIVNIAQEVKRAFISRRRLEQYRKSDLVPRVFGERQERIQKGN
jgi:hypothetical protein